MTISRRRLMGSGLNAAMALGGWLAVRSVGAAQNAALRTALRYQDTPKGEQKCSGCMHFVAGKSPADRGGCKVMPVDSEISPNGWCISWVAAPIK